MGFILTTEITQNTSEVPILLLKNPQGSTNTWDLTTFLVASSSSQGTLILRIYGNPTITDNGSDISATIQDSNFGVSTPIPSIMNIFSGPAASSNGTKLLTTVAQAATNGFSLIQNNLLSLHPNSAILMTAQASNLGINPNMSASMTIKWDEDVIL